MLLMLRVLFLLKFQFPSLCYKSKHSHSQPAKESNLLYGFKCQEMFKIQCSLPLKITMSLVWEISITWADLKNTQIFQHSKEYSLDHFLKEKENTSSKISKDTQSEPFIFICFFIKCSAGTKYKVFYVPSKYSFLAHNYHFKLISLEHKCLTSHKQGCGEIYLPHALNFQFVSMMLNQGNKKVFRVNFHYFFPM